MADDAGLSLTSSAQKLINKGRRRKITLLQWKRHNQKIKRNTGQPYIGYKNRPKAGKMPQNEVPRCKCAYQCRTLSVEDMKKMFHKFYGLDYNGQTRHLADTCVEICEINRRYTDEAISKRHCSFKYYVVQGNSKKIQVCQQTLCKIYVITPRRLQKLQDKIKFNKPLTDLRGKHDNRPNKISTDILDAIRSHIEKIPKQESHYSRHRTQILYLRSDLTIRKLYELFKNENPAIKCSLRAYSDIFNGEFKLKFGLPRSDTCGHCDRLFIQLAACDNDDQRQAIEIESKIHHYSADAGYKALNEDEKKAKINENYIVLCTDLQQVLYCPTVTHNAVFYQRQLSTYNQAVHNLRNNNAWMFVWPETTAKRGSGEVTSCLLKYITSEFKPLENGRERKLVVWSDRCIGQNNNWKHIALFQYLINLGYFTSVEQKFLITGHSFLPCDRDFAYIERNKTKYIVYEPFQWVEVTVTSKIKNYFQVYYMYQDDFIDISIIEAGIRKEPNFKITDYVWMKISSDSPTVLQSRVSHNVLQPWTNTNLAMYPKYARGKNRVPLPPVVVSLQNLPPIYKEEIALPEEKKKDLLDIIQHIPPQYRTFYENLK